MTEIQQRLYAMGDGAYLDFNAALIPTVDKNTVIGVRTPALKKLAKELKGSVLAEEFLSSLPHEYFEENQLHAFLLAEIKTTGVEPKSVSDGRFFPMLRQSP